MGLGFAAWLLATEMLERLHEGGLFDLVDGARIIERARDDVEDFSAFVTGENRTSASAALGRLHVSWLRRHPGIPKVSSDDDRHAPHKDMVELSAQQKPEEE